MIEQLPHIKLSDTVDAMLFAASSPREEKLGGCTLATDTACVPLSLALPSRQVPRRSLTLICARRGIFRLPFVQAYRAS